MSLSTVGSVTEWRPRKPVRTTRRTIFQSLARSSEKCFRRTRIYRPSSVARGSGDPQGVLRGAAIVSASSIMIIAQISDTHLELNTPDADQRIGDFERTIAAINCLDPVPDVIVHTGDIVHNGREDEYARAASILAKARMPVY